jgi:hypothetical protein
MKNRVFEMSVSIQSLFTPDELALELEWLKARDALLGQNKEHPQCQWLTSLFAGKTVTTVKEACDVFLEEKKSPASLCFAALVGRPRNYPLLYQSAELGYPLALAQMADMRFGEERFQFANQQLLCAIVVAFIGSGAPTSMSAVDGKRIWTRPENTIWSLLNSTRSLR